MHPAWWWLFPWIGLARMTEAYQTASEILREQAVELHKLQLEAVGRRHASGVVSQEVSALREEVERLRLESARRGARVARLAECVRGAHDILLMQVEEMRPFVPVGYQEWLAQPEVKLAIEEEL